MAASDAKPFPIKNQAYRVTFPIFDADGDLVTGAAGLDSEVSKDGGTFTDCTNEATEIATSSGIYYLDLTATEMNADTVAVIVKTSTTGAKTTPIVLYPVESGDIPVNVKAISDDTTAADNLEAATDGTGYNIGGGQVVVASVASGGITASSIATGAIDADALAADAVDEILDEVVEGSLTLRGVLRLLLSVLTGLSSGGGTTQITFRDVGNTTNRVVMTVNTSGDRSAVTLNAN